MADSNDLSVQLDGQDQAPSGRPAINGSGLLQANRATNAAKIPGELSNAEKKRLAKADKAAKRARAKESQFSSSSVRPAAPASHAPVSQHSGESMPDGQAVTLHTRAGSMSSGSAMARSLPSRRRQSQGAGNQLKQEHKVVECFAHLYGQPRRRNLEGIAKEVHPAISALALQQSNYVICGSHARCVAMLLALKLVISSYTTPHGTSLPRHLASHHLSPQLSQLKASRPFSTSQANSIRWLKNQIANLDPSTAEDDAKAHICSMIDNFIRDRFTVADQVIADSASQRIHDGDVILTFGKSAVVQAALVHAAERGVKFKVVVADGRPLMEGKRLAQRLASNVDVNYCLLPGLNQAMVDVTKCLLGAHAIFANGCLQSRVGSALVALAAKQRCIPVIVCAESIKLTDRVGLNSLMVNELAPDDELIDERCYIASPHEMQSKDTTKSDVNKQAGSKELKSKSVGPPAADTREQGVGELSSASLAGWQDKVNLRILNLLYDITPSDNLEVIITELGSFPPSAVPVVHKISSGS